MVIVLCMRWWYGAGWRWAVQRAIVQRLQWCNETFSMGGLVRTLFAPFKQTYSKPGGSIDIRIHAFFDNVISRCVGIVARSFILLAGSVACLFVLVTGIVFVILWPLAPGAIPLSIALLAVGVGR
jgi:hypothetical protein